MNVKNQHYIWQRYLKPWTSNGKIHCLRNGAAYETALKNVGSQTYFYRTEELTDEDIKFIQLLLSQNSPPNLIKTQNDWLDIFNKPFKFISGLKHSIDGNQVEKIAEIETWIKNNFHEFIHAKAEKEFSPYLDALLRMDTSFYRDSEKKGKFIYLLSIQYFRTNKIKSSVLEGIRHFPSVNMDRIWQPLVHLFATRLTWSLLAEKPAIQLRLLLNDSNEPFITGDQPVVNIRATFVPYPKEISELELYYPVSPRVAALLTYDTIDDGITKIGAINSSQYNIHIAKNSHDQIYSTSKTILEKYAAALRP